MKNKEKNHAALTVIKRQPNKSVINLGQTLWVSRGAFFAYKKLIQNVQYVR